MTTIVWLRHMGNGFSFTKNLPLLSALEGDMEKEAYLQSGVSAVAGSCPSAPYFRHRFTDLLSISHLPSCRRQHSVNRDWKEKSNEACTLNHECSDSYIHNKEKSAWFSTLVL